MVEVSILDSICTDLFNKNLNNENNMKIINIFIILICVTLITSCTSSTYSEISVNITNPTYTTNIEHIIKSNCTGCHDSGQFPNLTTYTQVKNATQNGNLICRIDQTQACGSVMPQSGPMSRQTIDVIILWKNQGCKN